jgi:hypothetical protein
MNVFESLFNKAKSQNKNLTKAEFKAKREETLSKADASGRALEGKVTVGGMVMEATPEQADEIAKDME